MVLLYVLLSQALEALNKKDLVEIRSFKRPPVLVEKVMAAVMIMRTSEPTWAEAQRQLSKIKLLGVGLGLRSKF